MRHKLLAAAIAGLAALVLAGCSLPIGAKSLQVDDGSLTTDGVSVTIESVTVAPTDRGWDYMFDVTIENESNVDVMQVSYGIAVYQADGEEIRSFGHVYDKETSAIAPGETVRDHLESSWGKAEPASVTLTGVTVVPASEMPAIHVPQTGEYLYQALGDEHLASIQSEPPVSLTFHIDQGGAGRTAELTPGKGLERAVSLLCDVKIGADNADFYTDNYNWIYLEWADGSHTSISLTLYNLEFSGHKNQFHVYTLENLEPFWNYAAGYTTPDGGEPIQDS